MVDLDSNPTKLIEIVEVGKQLLITRGALTTFSIANDVAKYFAILPAMFAFTYATKPGERGPLNALNIMHLGTPKSAIVSAIIFNALIIPALVPLALQRRQVPRDRRDRAPAPQPADLRARRHDPAVHRDQADRPDRPQPVRSVSCVARGHYRILLGMAAGVGKTYRMLQEGRQAQDEGRDVVIGYLEPHDRPETAALAEGLEVVPRLRAQHGDARARGDGRRRRRSAARPSSRSSTSSRTRTRRACATRSATQDIDEMLAAGIDVISTVNVQHLESLNDAIFELTDVRVRETFPDRILDEADEVVLVDLSPEALQERLRAGQGLPEGAGRGRARELLPRRQPRARCASSRCARSPRTSRRGASHGRSTRSASRRSPSACSRSSSRSRSRSGSCAAPGARRSGSAPRSTRSGCGRRDGRRPRRRRRSSRRCAGSRASSARTSSRRRATTSSTTVRRVAARARLDLRLRRHARRVAAPRDPPRLAALAHGARAARARHPRRREPRRPGRAACE